LLKDHITQHPEVQGFGHSYRQAFGDFEAFLYQQLIENWRGVNRNQHETILSEDLFARLQPIPLIDKYQAYQLLNNHWQTVATDLEILQTEGFATSKQVDPNLVIKKKDGKDTEVQDGWKGHVLPFELVQGVYLQEPLQVLKQKENRLAEISGELEAVLDSLSEEEKEADTVKEGKDGFVNAVVAKEAKLLRQEAKKNGPFGEDSYEAKILVVDDLITEEKALKAAVKRLAEDLHLKTKAVIEGFTDAQVLDLLALKWIRPLLVELMALPAGVINALTTQVQTLADKYAVTYGAVAQEITQTEQCLAGLIDELTGSEADMLGLAELKLMLGGGLNR